MYNRSNRSNRNDFSVNKVRGETSWEFMLGVLFSQVFIVVQLRNFESIGLFISLLTF
jgi:hypothetical protein